VRGGEWEGTDEATGPLGKPAVRERRYKGVERIGGGPLSCACGVVKSKCRGK